MISLIKGHWFRSTFFLCWIRKISSSLKQKKEVAELQAADLTLIGDEKVFLEEQLKYYFEFSDNRWNLNVLESELQVQSSKNIDPKRNRRINPSGII